MPHPFSTLLFIAGCISVASATPNPNPQQLDINSLPCEFSKRYCGWEIIEKFSFPDMVLGSRFCAAQPKSCTLYCGITGACGCHDECRQTVWSCGNGPDAYAWVEKCPAGCNEGACLG